MIIRAYIHAARIIYINFLRTLKQKLSVLALIKRNNPSQLNIIIGRYLIFEKNVSYNIFVV